MIAGVKGYAKRAIVYTIPCMFDAYAIYHGDTSMIGCLFTYLLSCTLFIGGIMSLFEDEVIGLLLSEDLKKKLETYREDRDDAEQTKKGSTTKPVGIIMTLLIYRYVGTRVIAAPDLWDTSGLLGLCVMRALRTWVFAMYIYRFARGVLRNLSD